MHRVVLLRHGESDWNQENRFTGWTDVDLSDKGRQEAQDGGEVAQREGLYVRHGLHLRAEAGDPYPLDRPRRDGPDVDPAGADWRLNERHYGALQGLNKAETAAKFGEAQVLIWRRSYDIPPPALERSDPRFPGNDPRYAGSLAAGASRSPNASRTPSRDSCRTGTGRSPPRSAGKRVVIAAHGNSLRALVKYLDDVSDEEIVDLNIPTGVPLVYELDDDLKPLGHYYLGDPAAVEAAMQAVANQGRAR